MTEQNRLVIPGAGAFGSRVSVRTPLAHVVAVLRRANPDAPYADVKHAAEQLRLGRGLSVAETPVPESVDAVTADAPEPAAPSARPAELDESRAAVEAWVATQKGLAMNKSGRIPKHVLTAYREANRAEMVAAMVPVVNADGTPAEPIPADTPPSEVH